MSRKLDLSAFRGDSDEEDSLLPRKSTLELNALKSRTFAHGNTKKSKKDLEKEAEERKRLEEEQETARVLAEFTDEFSGPSSGYGPMSGAGVYTRGRPGGGFVRAGGAPMVPNASGPAQPPREPAAMAFARPHRAQPRAPSPPSSAGPKAKGKRAMDSFLEEIKGNQAVREQRLGKIAKLEGSSVSALAAREGPGGVRMNEQESTNLFVGSLPPTVTEESLGRLFSENGPVATVKIMWPRGPEEIAAMHRGKVNLMGFVAFMKRRDAENAVKEMDGMKWGESRLQVGFSKPVPLPSRALYDFTPRDARRRSKSPSSDRYSRSRPRSRSPDPSYRRKARSRSRESRSPRGRRRRSDSRSKSRSRSRSPPPNPAAEAARKRWLATVPGEEAKFIRDIAEDVRSRGRAYEEALKDKERSNPKYAFFFESKTPQYHLYHSALNSRHRIPTPPPETFDDDGYASVYSSDSAEESEKERVGKGIIGKLARKRFEAMLRVMSGTRAEIARGMEFAVKKAEAADEIADIVCRSLKNDGTPVPRKLARLHLVSDILHNSASPLPNVWKYRLAFEKRLPQVFAHLKNVHESLRAYSGNISADVFKGQVQAVLDIWERWMVFTQDVQDALRAYFEGTQIPGDNAKSTVEAAPAPVESKKEPETMTRFKSSGFKSSFKPISAAPVPAPAPTSASRPAEAAEDVDGEPIDGDDLDGEPLNDDVDGEPIEDVDGEAMDEDLDGEAM